MKRLEPGTEIDGFAVEDCLHAGGMAHIYRVRYANGAADPGFPMVMKVPRMATGDGAENLVSFEVEHQMFQAVSGPHVPRLVAAGDLARLPYLVMEYVPGRTLQQWLATVGSVGQARDGNPKAMDALFDTTRHELTFHRVAYDHAAAAAAIRAAGLAQADAHRLALGR